MTAQPGSTPHADEQLSAWLDDELPAAELELLAARLSAVPELRARVGRYALIGSALRGADGQTEALASELAALHLSERVRAAIDGSAQSTERADAPGAARWLPYAAAATVALVALALIPQLRPVTVPESLVRQDGAAVVAAATLTPDRFQRSAAQRVAAGAQSSLSANRLTSYLVYHGEYSGMLSAKVTDSRIVNHRSFAGATPPGNGTPGNGTVGQ
jgi:negative regulator of sigma E activity